MQGLTCPNHPDTPAEWLDLYCQDCWETYSSACWWELIKSLVPEKEGDHRPGDRLLGAVN